MTSPCLAGNDSKGGKELEHSQKEQLFLYIGVIQEGIVRSGEGENL